MRRPVFSEFHVSKGPWEWMRNRYVRILVGVGLRRVGERRCACLYFGWWSRSSRVAGKPAPAESSKVLIPITAVRTGASLRAARPRMRPGLLLSRAQLRLRGAGRAASRLRPRAAPRRSLARVPVQLRREARVLRVMLQLAAAQARHRRAVRGRACPAVAIAPVQAVVAARSACRTYAPPTA